MPPTLLFLAANPTDTARLRVDQEYRVIDETLLKVRLRDAFTLEVVVRVDDLQSLFLR